MRHHSAVLVEGTYLAKFIVKQEVDKLRKTLETQSYWSARSDQASKMGNLDMCKSRT